MSDNVNRSIQVARDAIENTIITGDGNIVIVQASRERATVEEKPAETTIGPNPYMGVSAFHEDEADRFFGRQNKPKNCGTAFAI